MKVLVVDDDPLVLRALDTLLRDWGYDVVTLQEGRQGLELLQIDATISLAILDWQMPGLSGVEVCQQARQLIRNRPLHILLLTARRTTADILAGFAAGADDYVTKPFVPEELKARLKVGARLVKLQEDMGKQVKDLEAALGKVKQLQGLLPICSHCKKVRNDGIYWQDVETYLQQNSEVELTRGICPECYAKLLGREKA